VIVERRRIRSVVPGALLIFLVAACGSSNGPTPLPQPPASSGPPSNGPSLNLPPRIEGITASAERAEVDTEVSLTAAVHDDETSIDQLKFEWKADAGTFAGEGPSVKWRAPGGIRTPADYTVSVTVTETYGAADASGVRPTNVSTATAPVIRVHNSPKELGDISLKFLSDFANSSVSPADCLRDFTDSCRGKADERSDIEFNRGHFAILSSTLNLRNASVDSNGVSANITVACAFTSRITACDAGDSSCTVGSISSVSGDCLLTGKYEQKRWWLCDSHFRGRFGEGLRGFFGLR
jgi:hypothetical protein